jgi:hypothetical protein
LDTSSEWKKNGCLGRYWRTRCIVKIGKDVKKALDRWRGTEPEDDGSERMENEGSRSRGMDEGY